TAGPSLRSTASRNKAWGGRKANVLLGESSAFALTSIPPTQSTLYGPSAAIVEFDPVVCETRSRPNRSIIRVFEATGRCLSCDPQIFGPAQKFGWNSATALRAGARCHRALPIAQVSRPQTLKRDSVGTHDVRVDRLGGRHQPGVVLAQPTSRATL